MSEQINDIIKRIAQELESGCVCYLNRKTREIISIPDLSDSPDEEYYREIFQEDLNKIKQQKKDLITFDKLPSYEAFKIMERFVEEIPEKAFQVELERTLAGRKPFQNFKHKVDYSDYRQAWFDFKSKEYERIVEEKLRVEIND